MIQNRTRSDEDMKVGVLMDVDVAVDESVNL